MRLDDPLEAAERLAPFVLATHIKDAVLAFTARGLCWQARPVGSGILPLPDMLTAILRRRPSIALSIELHPRTYDLPIYDPRWLGFFPDLRPESLAAVVRLAAECERRYAEGSLRRPEVVEAIPWADRDLDWLASSLGYLRSVVPTLIESACDPAAKHAALQPARPAHHDRHPIEESRIVSLDQFRGYTVVGMLLVNFIGGYRGGAGDPQASQYVLQLRRHDHAPILLRGRIRIPPDVPETAGDRRHWAAIRAVLKRSAGLILLGFVVYHIDGSVKSWEELQGLSAGES